MDVKSVAARAGADGLSPAPYLKDVLDQNFPILPGAVGTSNSLFSPDVSRALLHEALLYLLRSMSHAVCYEAVYSKHQFSWALVTLYYSNYFCALSMNRLAGRAISTTASGNSYEVSSSAIQSSFSIERIKVNNHQLVWATNYDLYSSFNWKDTSYDGTIIKVINKNHYERKSREFINYHPNSYKELFITRSRKNDAVSFFGRNYSSSPGTVALLPFSDDMEKMIANLECRAIARQTILLTIFCEILRTLQPASRAILVEYFNNFSKNIMSRSPFNSKLKFVFQTFIKDILA